MLFLSPPTNNNKCVPHRCFTNTFSHSTTLSLNPLLPNPCCAPYTLPLGSTPVTHPFTLLLHITLTLYDHPRTNLMPWKIALNRSARAVFAEWDQFGFLFGVCDDAVWAVLNHPPPGGPLRARPDFPAPAALAAGDGGPAVRDAFKRATDARSAWLAVSAAFCAAILDS